jgi:hypothetical protein
MSRSPSRRRYHFTFTVRPARGPERKRPSIAAALAANVEQVLDSTALIAATRQAGVAVAQGVLKQFGLDLPDAVLLDWQGQVLR